MGHLKTQYSKATLRVLGRVGRTRVSLAVLRCRSETRAAACFRADRPTVAALPAAAGHVDGAAGRGAVLLEQRLVRGAPAAWLHRFATLDATLGPAPRRRRLPRCPTAFARARNYVAGAQYRWLERLVRSRRGRVQGSYLRV